MRRWYHPWGDGDNVRRDLFAYLFSAYPFCFYWYSGEAGWLEPVLNFLFIYNTVDWEGRCVWLLMFRLITKLIVATLDIHLNAIKYF